MSTYTARLGKGYAATVFAGAVQHRKPGRAGPPTSFIAMSLEKSAEAGAPAVAVDSLKPGPGLADRCAECAGEPAVANHGGRKGKGQHRVAYYPDARIDEPALPVASRAQKSAMFAMCVLIPVVTAATCALFSRGSPKPTFAPSAPQCVIQLAALHHPARANGRAERRAVDPKTRFPHRGKRLTGK